MNHFSVLLSTYSDVVTNCELNWLEFERIREVLLELDGIQQLPEVLVKMIWSWVGSNHLLDWSASKSKFVLINNDVFHHIKVGRNDPCFCGREKKYKHCCIGQYVKPPEKEEVFRYIHSSKYYRNTNIRKLIK
jgi:hypothetical protein